MATQILVIFVIRTQARSWASAAHPLLVASSLGALAAALAVVASPLGLGFGFVGLPATVWAMIAGLVAVYLAAAEIAKRHATLPPRR